MYRNTACPFQSETHKQLPRKLHALGNSEKNNLKSEEE